MRAGKWPGNHFYSVFSYSIRGCLLKFYSFNSFVLLLETSFSASLFPFSIQESVEEQLKTTKLVSLCIQWSESLEAGWGPPSPEELLEGAQCPLS